MSFDPNKTISARIKRRIVKNPAARWADLSSRLARWGAFVQGGLALIPADDLPSKFSIYAAVVFFVLIGVAKLIAEERNAK